MPAFNKEFYGLKNCNVALVLNQVTGLIAVNRKTAGYFYHSVTE